MFYGRLLNEFEAELREECKGNVREQNGGVQCGMNGFLMELEQRLFH